MVARPALNPLPGWRRLGGPKKHYLDPSGQEVPYRQYLKARLLGLVDTATRGLALTEARPAPPPPPPPVAPAVVDQAPPEVTYACLVRPRVGTKLTPFLCEVMHKTRQGAEQHTALLKRRFAEMAEVKALRRPFPGEPFPGSQRPPLVPRDF